MKKKKKENNSTFLVKLYHISDMQIVPVKAFDENTATQHAILIAMSRPDKFPKIQADRATISMPEIIKK
jgi:hypothetical protein